MSIPPDVAARQLAAEDRLLSHAQRAVLAAIGWQFESTDECRRKIAAMRFAARQLGETMARRFALEEQDGYMEVVTDHRPDLASSVEALGAAHEAFRRRLSTALRTLEKIAPTDQLELDRLEESLRALSADLDEHNQTEAALLQSCFSDDIGGEGSA